MSVILPTGETITDDTNPATGLKAGGHRTRFYPCLSAIATWTGQVQALAAQVLAYAGAAAGTVFPTVNSSNAGQSLLVGSTGLAYIVDTGARGFRNKIINGCMDIDQRNNGSAVTAEGAYAVDRFKVNFYGTGSAQRIAMSNTPELPGFSYYLKFIRTASGANFAGVVTSVENIKNLSGKQMTFSFWVRGDVINASGFSVWSYTRDDSGAFQAYSPNNGSAFAITSVWTRVSMRMDVPVITTAMGANGGYMEFSFRCSSASENFNISITGVQWEEGVVATPFERRPYGLELSLCQRYYQTFALWVGSATAKLSEIINMRATPTVAGGGAGFDSTGTSASALVCFQTTPALQTLTLSAEMP